MDHVIASALVGTGHQAPALPDSEPWEQALPADRPEQALLLRAGAWSVYRTAGRQALPAMATPEPAQAETKPECAPRALALLMELDGPQHYKPLYLEALRRLAAAGVRLPHAFLPEALDTREAAVREAMRPLLGERGAWLAQFKPGWAWARRVRRVEAYDVEALARLWQEGTPEERLAALQRVRQEDAALGRTWLMEGFSKEKADQRTAWIKVLGETLVPEDEAFLEICLGDRAGEVRAQAARLLARLPGSGLAARMRERALAHVRYHKGFFRATLTLHAPEELPKEWARDGIGGQYPGTSPRDGWLRDLVSFVPPDFWQAQFGGQPEQVVAIAARTEDTLPFMLGLADAVTAFESEGWAAGLLQVLTVHRQARPWDMQECFRTPIAEMLRRVPPARLEALILERLLVDDLRDAFYWLAEHHAPWSDRLADAYLGRLRRHLEKSSQVQGYAYWNDPWTPTLDLMGLWLPPEAMPRLEAILPPRPADGAQPPHYALLNFLDRAREVLALRQRIQKEITA